MGFAGRVWHALLKERDLLGEVARERDERGQLRARRHARASLGALEAAAGRGEEVADEVVIAEAEVEDLTALLPRGNNKYFLGSVWFCIAMAVMHISGGIQFRHVVARAWGTLDNPYLLEHSYTATRICLVGQRLRSPVRSGVVLAAFLGLLWYVQHGLQRRHARVLLCVAMAAVFAAAMVLSHARLKLIMLTSDHFSKELWRTLPLLPPD